MDYKSPDEIAVIIYSEMCPSDIHAVIDDCKLPEDMIRYHHSVGRSIRNRFGLWESNNPYTKGKHPDDVSHEILKKVWILTTTKNLPIDELISLD